MPGLARVGRNEPCPCGSGRKYKVCCLRRDEAFETARDGATELAQILLRCVRMPEVFPSIERLWDRYWPEDPPKDLATALNTNTGSEEDPVEVDTPPFLVWVVHGAPLDGLPAAEGLARKSARGTPTLLDFAMGDRDEPAHTPAGALAEALRNSVASAFQVVRRQPGRRIWLRDVFTDETFEVGDRMLSEEAATGEVLIMRIRPLEGLYEAVGSAWRFPATEVRALRPWGEMQLSGLREVEPDAGWRDLWRERWELLHHYVLERRRQPRRPQLFTTTGEPVVFCRVEWRVRDAAAVAAALDARGPEIHRDGDEPEWTWVPAHGDARWVQRTPAGEAEAPGSGLLPGGPALGRIALEGDAERLVLETMSAERAEAGRALVESLAGAHLAFLGDRRRSVEEMLAEGPDGRSGPGLAPGGPGEHAAEVPEAALREAAEAFFADYERRWVDMPIPALGGRTPRQAAASADPLVRRQLQDLLLEFEEAETRARRGPGGAGMSVARVRRRLGMDGAGAGR